MDSANLSVSSQRLPFDILYNIADELASNMGEAKNLKTLSALSRVCSPLTNPCQRHIFEMICLLPHDVDKIILGLNMRMNARSGCFMHLKTLETTLNANPAISTYIRHLEYNCHPADVNDNSISNVLNKLNNVHTLFITRLCGKRQILDWKNIPEKLFNSFRRLLSLPTLRHLKITDGRNFPIDFLSRTNNLRSLYISGLGFEPSAFLGAGYPMTSFDHLKQLTFGLTKGPGGINDIQAMFLLGGLRNLESLTLIFRQHFVRPNLHIISSALSNVAPKLRRLNIHSMLMMPPFGFPPSGKFIFEIIKDVDRWDHLERLEISLFVFPGVDHVSDLRRVDEHVCNEKVFPALRSVNLHVDTLESLMEDREHIIVWEQLPQVYLTNLATSTKVDLEYTTLSFCDREDHESESEPVN